MHSSGRTALDSLQHELDALQANRFRLELHVKPNDEISYGKRQREMKTYLAML